MNTRRVVLEVSGIGNVPSKKNSKMLTRGHLITKPEYQKWMEKCIQGFVSQLSSGTATIEEGMQTGALPQSLIASLMPEDDSWQWIPEIRILASKGNHNSGALITIEQI